MKQMPLDDPDLPEPGHAAVARLLAEEATTQLERPWRTLWRHYVLTFLRAALRFGFLSERRREKLRGQVAKREPKRFLAMAAEVESLHATATANAGQSTGYVPYDPTIVPPYTSVRAIALYLPQFHPFPENDQWWGKGFTEWTNVGKARPLFKGHYQPHCPIHLGYYDLRIPEVMQEQSAIAQQYGIGGFAYHFYWFAGRTIMEQPLRSMLQDPLVRMPFMLNWANENWTRRWDGRDSEILITQSYSLEDSKAMIRHAADYMRDERYIRVNGRPVFSVYRPQNIPDLPNMVDAWRSEAQRLGVGDLHLVAVQVSSGDDHRAAGFDANLEFAPHGIAVEDLSDAYGRLGESFSGRIHSYDGMVQAALQQEDSVARYRCVTLGWDNTARVPTRATIFDGFTIEAYQRWLTELCNRARTESWRKPDERIVFINAWNEWAEGTHLGPDQRYGFAYLEATRQAVLGQVSR